MFVKSAQTVLGQSKAACLADCLLVSSLTDGERLELHSVAWAERECTNQEVKGNFLLLVLHSLDYLITDELKHSLYDLGCAVAHVSDSLEAGGDEFAVDKLDKKSIR